MGTRCQKCCISVKLTTTLTLYSLNMPMHKNIYKKQEINTQLTYEII